MFFEKIEIRSVEVKREKEGKKVVGGGGQREGGPKPTRGRF